MRINTEKLREFIRSKGCTQSELSEAIGVRRPSISDWVNEKSEPHPSNVRALADYLGTTVAELTSEQPSGMPAQQSIPEQPAPPSESPAIRTAREQVELLRLKLEAAKLRKAIIEAGGDPDETPPPPIPPAPTALPPGVTRAGFKARKAVPGEGNGHGAQSRLAK